MKYKVLTNGKLATEFAASVNQHYADIEVLLARSQREVKLLLPKANAIAGFNFLGDENVSHLKWIHSFGAGVDAFFTNKSLAEEVVLTRTTGKLGVKIGEFCLSYLLADLRALLPTYGNQKEAHWEQLPTQNLYDKTILILGTGSIGSGIAQIMKGLCKQLVGLNSTGSSNELFDQVHDWESYKQIAKNVDIVVSALPSTEKTNAILNADFFAHFRRVLFINVGRGNALKEEVLLHSLHNGEVRRAVLDVFETEPLPKSSKLWSHEQVLVSPHQSGITSIDEVLECFGRAYEALKRGCSNELFVDIGKGY